MTTDTQHEAAGAEADAVTVESTEGEQAKELLAKARFDAFRIVTDGRKEAESILEEARTEAARIIDEAASTAASLVTNARREAEEKQASTDETSSEADATKTAVAELEEEHQQLTDRVGSLRALADQLEERFAALAAHANTSNVAGSSDNDETQSDPADEERGPVFDYSPSVAPPPEVSDTGDDEDDVPVERGSFYSRRSAKLPSIGDAGGKSALDMMRAIRETFDDSQ
jgi:vacuolar-type H+-ATPase subunit E/Vma4